MRRISKSYFVLIAAIFMLSSLPKNRSESMRGQMVASLTPLWESLSKVKNGVGSLFGQTKENQEVNRKIQLLQLQNQQLQAELAKMKGALIQLSHVERQAENGELPKKLQKIQNRHWKLLQNQLKLQFQALPAEVIFRSPSSWNSSIWLNVGEANNRQLGSQVVAKNSPVVVGSSIVGLVEYVGEHQCRVRLITDSSMSLSVRAARGDLQQFLLLDHLETLKDLMNYNDQLPVKSKELFTRHIVHFEKEIASQEKRGFEYLAKGELCGVNKPLWRSFRNEMKGTGFNYDFDDEEGPARDLRASKEQAILKKGDLLIATGMDGVFPKGFQVAYVTHIENLREGDYYYNLEAMPTAGNLHELSLVFVMPPRGYEPE